MSPSVHPTSDLFRPFLLLGSFLKVFANGWVGGARRFVKCLPTFLPGLYNWDACEFGGGEEV